MQKEDYRGLSGGRSSQTESSECFIQRNEGIKESEIQELLLSFDLSLNKLIIERNKIKIKIRISKRGNKFPLINNN